MTEDENMERRKDLNNSFRVPSDYFEELAGKINSTISLMENENQPAGNPFIAPDGYFEKLSVSISDKIANKKPSFLQQRIVWIPAACALLIAAFIYITHMRNERRMFSSSDPEIENSTLLQTIDEDMLIDALASYQLNSEPDSLTQYIIDNNIEQFDLENAL